MIELPVNSEQDAPINFDRINENAERARIEECKYDLKRILNIIVKHKQGLRNLQDMQYIMDCYEKFSLDVTMYK